MQILFPDPLPPPVPSLVLVHFNNSTRAVLTQRNLAELAVILAPKCSWISSTATDIT